MNWLQAIIFGIVSGISEFLPISAQAHRNIFLWLFGIDGIDPLRDLVVHIALTVALILASSSISCTIIRATSGYQKTQRVSRDHRLIRAATLPMLLAYLALSYITRNIPIPMISLFLLVNGIILYLPDRMLQGNKDARYMTRSEYVLIGLCGAAAALTGISGFGLILFVAAARGAHRIHAVNWGLHLCLPMLFLRIVMDIFTIFINLHSITFSATLPGYLLFAAFAFLSGYLAIKLARYLGAKIGFSAFSYYCWGAALFTFILYLI